MKRFVLLIALLAVTFMTTLADASTCLNFIAVNGPATIKLDSVGVPYSVDMQYSTDGATWNTYPIGNTINLADGQSVYFKALNTNDNFSKDTSNYYFFVMTGSVAADGNIMSLLDANMISTSAPSYSFYSLFINCTSLATAPSLPAVTLANDCYRRMFKGCTSLTVAPSLPATALATCCYMEMFSDCTSLTVAPSLPATTLAAWCYGDMFWGCTSLAVAPSLPATTLTDACYNGMFCGCTSLIVPPSLPATTLANDCYGVMFQDCTSLTAAPSLPATILPDACYWYMFSNCSSLEVNVQGPGTQWMIPATTDAATSLTDMFLGTAGTMNGTPSLNTVYYINSQQVDTASADVSFYFQKEYNSVPVTGYHLVLYKIGGTDTLNEYFSNDTTYMMNRKPRVIEIVDSVTGSTTTVTISIDHSLSPTMDMVTVHLENLAPNSTYSVTVTPLGEARVALDSAANCNFTTGGSTPVIDVYEDDDTDGFFPTEETDVYTTDGRYIGKYYLDLPPGIYLMREKGRWHKFGKVR